MVGPRSTGCRRCVNRKVKCDETRPACNRCQIAGYDCTGYNPPIRFMAPIALGLSRPRARMSDQQIRPLEQQSRHHLPNNPSPQNSMIAVENMAQSASVSDQLRRGPLSISQSILSKDVEDVQLLSKFVHEVKPQLFFTKFWLNVLCNTPDELSVNAAVRALACAHGAVAVGGSLVERSRQAYGESLAHLRKAVARPRSAHLAALQNTILALSMCEFYDACLSGESKQLTLRKLGGHISKYHTWTYHANAIHQIMKLQGPQPYTEGLDRFVYLAMRDLMVILAYKMKTRCFLNDPSWRTVIPYTGSYNYRPGPQVFRDFDHAFEILFACHVQGPQLQQDSQRVVSRGEGTSDITRRALDLRKEALESFAIFMHALRLTSRMPVDISCPGNIPDVVYSFKDVTFAEVLTPQAICNHHSLMIIINDTLLRVGSPFSPDLLGEEKWKSALEICKCIPALENIPANMMGVFNLAFMPFFIERALSACAPKYEPWLRSKMEFWSIENA